MTIIGSNIIRLQSAGSTSDEARKIFAASSEGTVIIAEEQTNGRGKPGNIWFSPAGGLYFSVILKPYKNPSELFNFTLMSGKAVLNAISSLYNLEGALKPPNDVTLNGKKVGGVLTEKTGGAVIVGIGVNLNTIDFPEELKDKATSIKLETKQDSDKEQFFAMLMQCLDKEYSKFLKGEV